MGIQKKIMLSVVVCFLLFSGCVQFPTSFNWVESERIRVLDFIYEPAEAAPGDTVTLLAVFAGDSITSSDVTWNVSYKLGGNAFNLDIADSIVPLVYTPLDTAFSRNTFTVAIRFTIPENVMEESGMIPEDWGSIIPKEFQQYVPPEILSMSKKQFLDTIESFIGQPINPEMQFFLPLIMEMLTIKIRLFANVKGILPIRSDYTVRYNTYFADVPRVNVNTNPVINSIGVYKVKGANLLSFDSTRDSYEYFRLFASDDDSLSDTIIVDKGYTYFIDAKSENFDSVYSVLAFISPDYKDTMETHFFGWFYQFDDTEIEDVDAYDLMSIAIATGSSQEVLYPPADKRVKTFTLWAQAYDYNLTERYRPDGSMLKEVCGVFRYE